MTNFDLSSLLQKNPELSHKQQINYVFKLSVPGIIAQISSIVMQYIDAAMVGALGADASAAIGLVASSTWLLGSLTHAVCIGFSVQVAQAIGAGDRKNPKRIFIQSIYSCVFVSLLLALISFLISKPLPYWLGASQTISFGASSYFMIYGLSTPFFITVYLMSGMLQCTGNMKLPAIMNAGMCLLDIVFNYIFIYVFKLGVTGAALGTSCSALVTAFVLIYFTVCKSEYLNLSSEKNFSIDFSFIKKAFKIGAPIAVESSAFTSALVVVSKMIAPLGSIALSANSFAVTAEALCYMPGYGIQEAAITLVGQSVGAKRKDLIKSFSLITVLSGITVMSLTAVLMYFICPAVFSFLTPDLQIKELSIKILRIELFAEPLYAASIVASGALRGKGDTLVPGILNLFSLWGVRIILSLLLLPSYGLTGVWTAMAIELCFRGTVLLLRLFLNHK